MQYREINVLTAAAKKALPEKLAELIPYLQEILNSVPEEYQHQVDIHFNTDWDRFEGEYVEMDINYVRPETEEEQAYRVAYDKIVADEEKARKLEQFEKLKKELGL